MNHFGHLAFPDSKQLRYHAYKVLRYVNHQQLHRFMGDAIDFSSDNRGFRDLELISFAAHCFYDNGQGKFTATRDSEGVGYVRFFDVKADVAALFEEKPFAQLARGYEFAFPAGPGRVVGAEEHGDRRLVDTQRR